MRLWHQLTSLQWSSFIRILLTRATVCKNGSPVLSDRRLSCPVCDADGQTVGWIKIQLGMEVRLGPGHIVLDEDPPTPKKGTAGHHPQFSAHVCCSQTAAWIKMPLGTEVSLGPWCHTVLDGNPAPPSIGAQQPHFWPVSIAAKRSPISATAELLLWQRYGIGQAIIF